MAVWTFVFGVVMVLVEDFRFSGDFRRGITRRRLYYMFRFLFLPPGRGYFYLLAGSVMASRAEPGGWTPEAAVGAYVVGLAVLSIGIGHGTDRELGRLKEAFGSETAVRHQLVSFQMAKAAARQQAGGGSSSGGGGGGGGASSLAAGGGGDAAGDAGEAVGDDELTPDDFRRFCTVVRVRRHPNSAQRVVGWLRRGKHKDTSLGFLDGQARAFSSQSPLSSSSQMLTHPAGARHAPRGNFTGGR